MRVTTERLPKSLLALDIELDHDRFEKGLDRAARRLSQKHTIPGFRKGKAPRFVIEKMFGRAALVEEATEDLVTKTLEDALKQEQIEPVGKPEIQSIDDTSETFRFRVTLPMPPTMQLSDYHNIRIPLTPAPVTDYMVQNALHMLRDKHVALRELEEPRPSQQGDHLTVKMQTYVNGEPLQERDEHDDIPTTDLVLDPDRLISSVYKYLCGVSAGETVTFETRMPHNHQQQELRGQNATFEVEVLSVQERVLPEWDEVMDLEEFDGTMEEFQQVVYEDLTRASYDKATQELKEYFFQQLIAETTYDIADATIYQVAEKSWQEQEEELARYGVTPEQVLKHYGLTREQAVKQFFAVSENTIKSNMVWEEFVRRENLYVTQEELAGTIQALVLTYPEEEQEAALHALTNQHLHDIAQLVQEQKVRNRVVAIATGTNSTAPDDASLGSAPDQVQDMAHSDELSPMETEQETPTGVEHGKDES